MSIKFKNLALTFALLFLTTACSSSYTSAILNLLPGGGIGDDSGDGDDTSPLEKDIQAFSTHLHPVLTFNCAGCHGVDQNPKFAVDDAGLSYNALTARNLVDLTNPEGSYMLTVLGNGHNGFGSDVIDQITAGIQAWANVSGGGGNSNPTAFKASSDDSVLNKVKYLVHGGAVTEQEYQGYVTSANKVESLKNLIDTWSNTDEGKGKLKFYLDRALNQDFVDAVGLLSNGGIPIARQNMRESFARTALDIIERDRPFHEIATTKRFAVTTGLLVVYAWMDRRSDPVLYSGTADSLLNRTENRVPATFNDWRFINFAQNDNEQVSFTNFDYYKNLNNDATVTFSIPRVGYFTTPAFLSSYLTNANNQFRVTINQTLIAGLGKSFSTSDLTPQANLVHLDEVHAPQSSECYKCHRLMDPMRNIFRNKMDNEYKFSSEFSNDLNSFAIDGHTNQMTTIDDLGTSIATHPDFAAAWVQKMCVALNTTNCLITDPEYIRITQAFQASNYNFKTLYRELASSSLITGAELTSTTTTNGFFVNRLRKTHFCQNVNSRFRQIQAIRGVATDAYDNDGGLCEETELRDLVDSLGDDLTVRGLLNVVNSFTLDTFARQGIENICVALGELIVSEGSQYINGSEANLSSDLGLLTNYLVGLNTSHPRHDAFRGVIGNVYSDMRSQLLMSHEDAMKQVVAFACTSPDFTGVGL